MNAPVDAGAVTPLALRHALGRFTTGVTIITCLDAAGSPVGLTASSFNALSLDPPLVLWSLRRKGILETAFTAAPHFAVHVLAESQIELARRFASREADKFAVGPWSHAAGVPPLLAGCAAVFECETVSHQIAGDHLLFIGHVLRVQESAVPPLLFQASHYRTIGHSL